jgi:membrane protease YdiL (CAAX protease family)
VKSTLYKLAEFFIIFILIPVSFAIRYPVWIKLTIGGLGLAYVIFVLLKLEKNKFKVAKGLDWRSFWRRTLVQLAVIIFITTAYVWFTDKTLLFGVLIHKPKLWIIILFIYALFSVYPQELIYRTFYFQRYEMFFKSRNLFIFLNATIFSLAHMFLKNSLVMLLTFLGGILFAITFHKTRSTLLVSIEHAIYGIWLFTVGMGEMLAFPS